jgi:6-pyruvoyltetrahydropterin/6-carboxytetrahydropterin synthase
MPRFYSTKTFGNERGLSCTYRQWRADTHCRFLHGYSIGVRFVFTASELDARNWVYDFGDTKWIKAFLEENFDHTTCIAKDDPELATFQTLADKKLIQLNVLDGVGCEKFAEYIALHVNPILQTNTKGRVCLKSVEVFEHAANSAIYEFDIT